VPLFDTVWFCNAGDQSTTGHYAVTKRPQNTAVAAGVLRRQFTAPAVGNERVFVCVVAGTTANVTDATWVLTRGAKTTDGTATWQECTGASAVNGDLADTPTWAAAKAIATAVTLGAIIQRANGASYWICSTAGNTGASEPAWTNNTAGTTQTDSTVIWTCLGVVGNFTGGGAPHARLANACATNWFAVGNTLYVGDNHAESQATAITITPVLSASNVGRILCHNHSGSYPPAAGDLTTGATVSTTTNVNLTFNPGTGAIYVYGLRFQAGVGASTTNSFLILTPGNAIYVFDNCVFQIANTVASAVTIQLNTTTAGVVLWNNCQVSFGNVLNYIEVGTTAFTWQNTGQVLASGSAVPTNFIGQSANGRLANVLLEALDLSQLTGALINLTITYEMGNWLVKDCKLNAAVTIPTPTVFGQAIQLIRSDSGGTAYKSARYTYEGTETTETSITRVNGATDPSGQAQSRKIASTANALWLRPFQAEPYAIWNPTTGSNVTVTVYGTINAGALPNNDDIWLDVEYLGNASYPVGSIANTTKASTLAANAAVASDGSTWNTPGVTLDGTTAGGATVSGGGLTVTHTTGTNHAGVFSTAAATAGKYYFEMKVVTAFISTENIGVGSGLLSDAAFNNNFTGVSLGTGSSSIITNNVGAVANLGITAVGDVYGFALDLTAKLAWIRRNNGNWNNDASANPATGTNGLTIAAGAFAPMVRFTTGGGTEAVTANFGATTYANAAPAGFGNWPAGWLPFKLVATLSAPQPGLPGILEARVRVGKASATYYVDPTVALS
jgi:hypothetical protein